MKERIDDSHSGIIYNAIVKCWVLAVKGNKYTT